MTKHSDSQVAVGKTMPSPGYRYQEYQAQSGSVSYEPQQAPAGSRGITMRWMDGAVAHRLSKQFYLDADGQYYFRCTDGNRIFSAEALRDVAQLIDWVNLVRHEKVWRQWKVI